MDGQIARREFLRGAAALGAGLVISGSGALDAEARQTKIRWGGLALPRNGQKDQIEALKALQQMVGRPFATTHFRVPFDHDLVNPFTTWSVKSGHVPIISWFTFLSGGGMIPWRSVADGDHDDRIRSQARALAKQGWSGYFCFHKEPENDAGSATDWKAAHERVHRIFHDEGAKFRFVPTLTAYTYAGGNGGSGAWLPRHYDLLGVDGYNRSGGSPGWRSFKDIFGPAHRVARRKGMGLYIIEYGSTEGSPGAKAHWFDGARSTMKRWPQLVGCSYNHESTDRVYWVDTSTTSLHAFRQMGADRAF
jgi:hypothetical protein